MGVSYDYMNIDSNPKFETNGMGVFLGLGYDFNRITLNLNVDLMILAMTRYQGYGYSNSVDIKKASYIGAGLNLGYKIINGKVFDLTIPLGVYLRSSRFEVHHDNDRKFKYFFVNAESGLMFSWLLSNKTENLSKRRMMFVIPGTIGYPLYKTNTVENYPSNSFTVLNYSIGFGWRITY
jgi:hypothetical protein